MELLEELSLIFEARGLIRNVVRHGAMKQILDCPPGYRSKDGKCVLMTPMERLARKKSSRIAIRTRARNAGRNKMSSLKSKIKSDRVRKIKTNLLKKVRIGG